MILFLDLFGCCKNALEITIHIFIHFFKSNFFHVKRQLYIVFIFSKIWFWSLIALESKQKNYSFLLPKFQIPYLDMPILIPSISRYKVISDNGVSFVWHFKSIDHTSWF